jgi:hypothetical protein
MAHHGYEPFDGEGPDFQRKHQLIREMQKHLLATTAEFRGAIGDYPEGQLTPSDEGSIQFAIGEQDGKVVIDFGTSVHWLGMTPQQAADFASAVIKRARLVARKNGDTVGFTI